MLIDTETVLLHLRAEDTDETALVEMWISAAQRYAEEFLDRRIYADDTESSVALSTLPALLSSASDTYAAEVDTAYAMAVGSGQDFALYAAQRKYDAVLYEAQIVTAGIVVNDLIKAAMLLIIGMLYEHREDAVSGASFSQLPIGSQQLLYPFRAGLGA